MEKQGAGGEPVHFAPERFEPFGEGRIAVYEFVVLETVAAQHLLRPQAADVGAAALDRVDADVASIEKVELNGVADGTEEMGLEPEKAVAPGSGGLASVGRNFGHGG